MSEEQPIDDVRAVTELIIDLLPDACALVASPDNGAPEIAWGDVFFYAGETDGALPQHQPFATIVTKDYPGFDEASALDRPDAFRLNLQLDRRSFDELYPEDVADEPIDFAARDVVMPHPVYSKQHWVSVVCPSPGRLAEIVPWLEQAHERAARRVE